MLLDVVNRGNRVGLPVFNSAPRVTIEPDTPVDYDVDLGNGFLMHASLWRQSARRGPPRAGPKGLARQEKAAKSIMMAPFGSVKGFPMTMGDGITRREMAEALRKESDRTEKGMADLAKVC